jgi:hypothetical protein
MKKIILILISTISAVCGGILDRKAPASFRYKMMTSSEALYLVRGWIEGSGDEYFSWKGNIPKELRTHEVAIRLRKDKTDPSSLG